MRTTRMTTAGERVRCGRRVSAALGACLAVACGAGALSAADGLVVRPERIVLDRPEAALQLVVQGMPTGTSRPIDLTRKATYAVAEPRLVSVDEQGLVQPLAEGRCEVVVAWEGRSVRVPVEVSGLESPAPVLFADDILPILTKAACNSGGCHGKAEGQAGFKLSIFGFDAAADFATLTKESRGRRVDRSRPEASLLLKKGTAAVPHGGGRKLLAGSLGYRRLVRWVSEGAAYGEPLPVVAAVPPAKGVPKKAGPNAKTAPVVPAVPEPVVEPVVERVRVVGIEAEPTSVVLHARESQQVRVSAVLSDGRRRDVTIEAEYESNAGVIAETDGRGFVQAGDVPGEAAILAKYSGHVAIARITVPHPGVKFARPAETNFVDRHVWDALERLGIPPSPGCDDATFLRRASLDVIGTLPTADEARRFLEDQTPDKRARLVETLLARDEYADFWAQQWADILRADRDDVTPQGAVAVTRWLRRQFRENRPYDQTARDIVTAQGSIRAEGPASFFKVLATPEVSSRAVSQLFLGVRIECAQCHHHPSEKWGQDDFAGFAGFFTGVTTKKLPTGEEAVSLKPAIDVKHPRTGLPVPARALGAADADFAAVRDRRAVLAQWMTGPENPFFARMMANRMWAHYFGRGLVEPIDDMRATNPAVNEPLLAALAAHLREVRYDLKAFTRTLLASRAYQASGGTVPGNESDLRNFSHALPKAMRAEVLLDAICQATGVPEKFVGWPAGARAIQVWDNRLPHYFFTIFGRPVRASVCECERSSEPSVVQALHLLNSPEIADKIRARQGIARHLADSDATPERIVETLSLGTLSRLPTPDEKTLMLEAFAAGDRRSAVEDVLWALLNSKEFLYVR